MFAIETGCPIVDKIAHGVLNVVQDGAKLEVTCDLGYSIDGPSFTYCNDVLEWNEELRGCKGLSKVLISYYSFKRQFFTLNL